MGVKYQVLCCKFPEELLQITYTHLQGVISLIKASTEFILLNQVEETFKKKYEKYSIYELERVRQTLLKFFQGKQVKVSLFIQEGMQNLNGVLLFPKDQIQPPGIKTPGDI